MDDRVDIIIIFQENRDTNTLAKDVPHESPEASRVLDHDLEQEPFKAKRFTDEGVGNHAGEWDTKDEEAWNPVNVQG